MDSVFMRFQTIKEHHTFNTQRIMGADIWEDFFKEMTIGLGSLVGNDFSPAS